MAKTREPFASERVLLARLKVGETFTFEAGGPVYVRSTGGYRPARGGPLVKHSADQRVYRYA